MSKYSQTLAIGLVVMASLALPNQVIATSLYDKNKPVSLTADKRANKVGDTVTILVIENSQASSSAGTNADSGFAIDGQARAQDKDWRYGVGIGSSNNGDASTSRKGFIRSQITAVVTAIDANGNLSLKGSHTLTIDGETQKIELTGKARKTDIYANNTLLSNRLFEANIKYVGEGDVSSGKEPSGIYKLFKWIGLI